MFSTNKFIKNISFVFSVLTFSFVLSYSVLAWTEPLLEPPAGNIKAPINAGPDSQLKEGNLQVNALSTGTASGNALLIPNGNVGIGTISPIAKLEVTANPTVLAGACTVSKTATPKRVLIGGGAGCGISELEISVGSQIIVDFGSFKDARLVTGVFNNLNFITNEVVTDIWNNRTFSYIKNARGIKNDGTLTTQGMVEFNGNYEGQGGISIPYMDINVGGGYDSQFAFRHIDVAGQSNRFFFLNQNDSVTMSLDTEKRNVGIGTRDPASAGALDVVSATGALIVPRMTTGQINAIVSPVEGSIVYDTTLGRFKFRDRSAGGVANWVIK